MGAWADLKIEAATMEGVAGADLYADAYGAVDIRTINDPAKGHLAAAKWRVETHLSTRFATQIAALDGSFETLMDTALTLTSVSRPLQRTLAYAYLFDHYGQERLRKDELIAEKRTEAGWEMQKALDAMEATMHASEPWKLALQSAAGESVRPTNTCWTL